MKKMYNSGLIVGRFQSLHYGHTEIIETACNLCDNVLVFVGSSQESGTETNPFTYETRKEMLHTVFSNKIIIKALPDKGYGNNRLWGNYVIEQAIQALGYLPEIFITGKENRRSEWLEDYDNIAELFLPKSIDISGREMRSFLLNNDYNSWKEYTPYKLWPYFKNLRESVINSKDIKKTKSI